MNYERSHRYDIFRKAKKKRDFSRESRRYYVNGTKKNEGARLGLKGKKRKKNIAHTCISLSMCVYSYACIYVKILPFQQCTAGHKPLREAVNLSRMLITPNPLHRKKAIPPHLIVFVSQVYHSFPHMLTTRELSSQ